MPFLAFFLSPIGRWFAGAAIIAAVCGGIWLHGDHHGAARIQAKWDAAVQAAIERGEKARSDAEHTIDGDPAGGVPNDKFDRDSGSM